MATNVSQMLIKSEPTSELADIEGASYCRCCFKLMTEEISPHSETLNWFEEIIQMPLRQCQRAESFCFDCSVSIESFVQFKKLAVLKQEKLVEAIDSCSNDFSELFFLKLKSDPLTVIIKEEVNNLTYMRKEASNELSMEPKTVKRPPKRAVDNLCCPICTRKVVDVVDHLSSCKGKQCNKCKYRTVDVDEMEQHKREKHGPDSLKAIHKAKRIKIEMIQLNEDVYVQQL